MTTSTRSVGIALGTDVAIGVAKAVAFVLTGSTAIMAELLHSVADATNQAFLAVGIVRSRHPPDRRYPYGFGRSQYIWALLSAAGVLFVGCGVSVVRGIQQVWAPEPLDHLGWGLAVLLLSLLLESVSLAVGLSAVRTSARAADQTLWQYLKRGPDPMGVAVVLEESSAVVGVTIALACVGLADATGNAVWDGVGSIAIGALLGATAVFLIDRNRHFLLGPTPPPDAVSRMVEVLRQSPVVDRIHDVKASQLGAEEVRFKAEVRFDGKELARRLLSDTDVRQAYASIDGPEALRRVLVDFGGQMTDAIGDEIDRIEADLSEEVPEARHVDLEPD